MNSAISEIIPVVTGDDGRMRVGGTRVLLDLLIYAYQRGETPEHIVQMYPTLQLDDVYLAIGYYLRHTDEVNAYLSRMEAEAAVFRQRWEGEIDAGQHPSPLTRSELERRLT